MDPILWGFLGFLGLLAVWAVVEKVLSARRRRRVAKDPRAQWRGGRKMLPEDARNIDFGGGDGYTNVNAYDDGIK